MRRDSIVVIIQAERFLFLFKIEIIIYCVIFVKVYRLVLLDVIFDIFFQILYLLRLNIAILQRS